MNTPDCWLSTVLHWIPAAARIHRRKYGVFFTLLFLHFSITCKPNLLSVYAYVSVLAFFFGLLYVESKQAETEKGAPA
jgi:hypothetical protein